MSTSVRPFFPLSAMVTGFVTVLIGFTSSAVLIFQAAEQAGEKLGLAMVDRG
nr:benzoate/H(+) symporter BenE family transporter [Denitromonas sp.]